MVGTYRVRGIIINTLLEVIRYMAHSYTHAQTIRHLSKVSLACVVALSSLAMAGCKDKTGGGAASTTEIKVGEYASLTGDTATFGQSTHLGIQMAIDEVNGTGGINGKKITLVTEDDASKPDQAQSVVTKLITQDKVVALLGEVASTRSMRGGAVCQQYQTPMISPSSTNPKVTQVGNYVFRVCFTDDFQGAVDAQFAHDQGYKRVAVFKDLKSDYSVGFSDVFATDFKKLGGTVPSVQTYQSGDTDFKAQLNSLKAGSPDAVLVPGYYTEMGTIARQAKDVGLNVPLLGGDGWDSPELIPGAGTALEGSFFADHYFATDLKDPSTQAFIEAFKAKNGKDPDALAALGYDTGKVLIDAIKRAKSVDRPGIRDALAETKDFPGVTGKITIDANRNARKAALVFQIKGKAFKVFKTYTPEQVGQ
jgi:branched-chain amino acid transport system substrate-binding protein